MAVRWGRSARAERTLRQGTSRTQREAIYPKTEFLVGFVGGLGLLGALALTRHLVLAVVVAVVLTVVGLATDVVAPRWRHLGVGAATGIVGAGVGLVGGVLVLVWALSLI